MTPWKLTKPEWKALAILLSSASTEGAGRPRVDDVKGIAEACLYRHYHGLSSGYRTFGWNRLPKEFGVSPSTANRRFREWSESGAWSRFWHALLVLRDRQGVLDRTELTPEEDGLIETVAPDRPERLVCEPWIVDRDRGRFPIGDLVTELERAYLFFNAHFFGKTLPVGVGISIERQSSRPCRGYFCGRVWRKNRRYLGHIALMSNVIGKGPKTVLQVLLHEMVHLRNNHHGLRDCHPVNQYHNRYFRDIAHLAGLVCLKRDVSRGYAFTSISEEGRNAIRLFAPNVDLFRWKS